MANIMNNLINFLLGFALNLIASIVIIRFIYYPSNQNKPYVFTFMALGTTLFFVLSLLTSIELSVGVGFGLFAIFSILRYRTDTIPIRDMTYLFVIAALSVMNAAGSSSAAWPQLMIANLGLVILLFVLEREWGFQFELSKEVVYEKIELIDPQHRAELLADLEARTGMRIKRVEIGKIDFMRDIAQLRVVFYTHQQGLALHAAGTLPSTDGRQDHDDD